MKKILVVLFMILPLVAMSQTKVRRGLRVGAIPENATNVDSIIRDGAVVKVYCDGGSSPAQIFVDSAALTLRYDLWSWSFTDSAQMEGGSKKLGAWFYPGPDSMDVDSSTVISLSASPNFTYNVHWASDISGADTDLFSSAKQVNGADATSTGEVDTPDNNAIPPKVWIWMTIVDRTSVPVNGAGFTFMGTYY